MCVYVYVCVMFHMCVCMCYMRGEYGLLAFVALQAVYVCACVLCVMYMSFRMGVYLYGEYVLGAYTSFLKTQ